MLKITRDDIIAELRREYRHRQALYPVWIAEEKYGLTQATAAHRLCCLEEAIRDMERLRDAEQRQERLFDG